MSGKWCVSAWSAGTHSVCVCTCHQNAKLLLSAISWGITYKDLIAKVVCDTSRMSAWSIDAQIAQGVFQKFLSLRSKK